MSTVTFLVSICLALLLPACGGAARTQNQDANAPVSGKLTTNPPAIESPQTRLAKIGTDLNIRPTALESAASIVQRVQIKALKDAVGTPESTASICQTSSSLRELLRLVEARRSAADAGNSPEASEALHNAIGKPLKKFDPKKEADRKAVGAEYEKARLKAEKAVRGDTALRNDLGAVIGGPCNDTCTDNTIALCQGVAPEASKALGDPTELSSGTGWQATFVEGLAGFLGDRAKDEAALYFMEEFFDDICSDQVATAFPETCSILPQIRGTAAQGSSVLAESFRADLEVLPIRVVAQRLFNISEPVTRALVTLSRKMRKGAPPLELVAGLSTSDELKVACQEEAKDIAPGTDSRKPPPQLTACLLIKVGAIVSVATSAKLLKSPSASLPSATSLQKSFEEATKNKLVCKEERIKPICDLKLSISDWQQLLDEIEAFRKVLEALKTNPPTAHPSDILPPTWRVVRTAASLIDADPTFRTRLQGADKIVEGLGLTMKGEYAAGIRMSLVASAALGETSGVHPKVARYLPLIVDVGSAKQPDDIQAALEAAAAPLGSWRLKTRGTHGSITGLVGAAAGFELPVDDDGRAGQGTIGAIGAVGLDLTWPTAEGWYMGVFFSALDVGQLLSVPFAADSVKLNGGTAVAKGGADLEIAQILAPGAYLHTSVLGPINVGLGPSIAPRLRRYETAGGPAPGDTNITVFRVQAFAAVDLTLLPF